MEEYTAWIELKSISEEELNERKAFEDSLRKTIKEGNFDKISAQLTPRALAKCNTNALVMAMETNFELRRLANKKGPDEEEFTKLAGSLDEFISCLFDPLKTGGRIRDVFLKASIDNVMDAAIEFKQMKPSSASAERVFSLLTNAFGSQQESALQDYLEASVMFRYNNAKRA